MEIEVPLIETPERLAEWIKEADVIHALKGRRKPTEYPVPLISFDTGVGFVTCSPEQIVCLRNAGEHLLQLFGCMLMRAFYGACESLEGGDNPEARLQVIADGLKRTMEEYKVWG